MEWNKRNRTGLPKELLGLDTAALTYSVRENDE